MKRAHPKRKTAAKPQRAGRLGPIARTWTPQEYDSAQLHAWADALLGIPFGARNKGDWSKPTILRDILLTDEHREAIAAFLRRLAATPAALDALHEKRRGRPSGSADDYRIALDYLVTLERAGKSESAVREVQQAWHLKSRSTVFDAYKACKHDAARELRRLEGNNPNMPRPDLLQTISDELRETVTA